MREEGRGPWGRGGFDNELETNFISMQACCLSRPAQTEFPRRPGRVGGSRRGAGGGRREKRGPTVDHCASPAPASSERQAPALESSPQCATLPESRIIYLPL